MMICGGRCGHAYAVLVEKILRVQPQVHKMYLLVRAIDAPSAEQRVQQEVSQFHHHLQQHTISSLSPASLHDMLPLARVTVVY
jgi:hypothetical protein